MATYRRCLVTSLRIIGILERLKKDPLGKGRLALRHVQATLLQKPANSVGERRMLLVNDRVLIVWPVDSQGSSVELSNSTASALAGLLVSQRELSTQSGLWLKGAVTVGDVLLSRDSLYGPGIVAVERMRARAHDPRIIVDPILVNNLLDNPPFQDNADLGSKLPAFFRARLRKSTDGWHYLDYLGLEQERTPQQEYELILSTHKKRIESQLGRELETEVRRGPFVWLARYHNRTVRRYRRKTGAQVDHLLISVEAPVDSSI